MAEKVEVTVEEGLMVVAAAAVGKGAREEMVEEMVVEDGMVEARVAAVATAVEKEEERTPLRR